MKKLIFLFVTFNCILLTVYAQDYHKIDSLKNVLNTLPPMNGTESDTMRMKTTIEIGKLFQDSKPDSAIFWFSSIVDTVFSEEKIKQTPRKLYFNASAMSKLGYVLENHESYTKSKEYFLKSLKIYELLGNKKEISICLNNLGIIFHHLYGYTGSIDYYTKSIDYYEKSLKISEEIGDKNGVSGCLINLGNVYKYTDPTKAIIYLKKGMAIAIEIDYKQWVANALICIGMINCEQGEYQQAIEHYEKAIKINEEIDNKRGISTCLASLGYIFQEQCYYTTAKEYYEKSLKIDEGLGDKNGMSTCFVNLGNVYSNQGDYPKAINYYEKSLKIDEELGDKSGMSICLLNLGDVFINQGNYPKAIEYYEKSLKVANLLGVVTGCYINICIALSNQGNYSKAIDYCEKSLKINEKYNLEYGIAITNLNYGNIYGNQGNYSKAIEYFEKALKSFEDPPENGDQISECFNNMGRIFYLQGNYLKSTEYFVKSQKFDEEHGAFVLLADRYPNLAEVYVKQQKYSEAASIYLKAIQMKRKLIHVNFITMSEKEKGLFLEKTGTVFNTLNEFASIVKSDSVISQCYDNTLLLKGLLLKSTRGIIDAVSKSNDTNLVNTFWRFKKLRNNIAELYSLPIKEREGNLDSLENLANDEERKLALFSKDYNDIQKQFNYKWTNVQTALKKDEAAIEFVKINCSLLLKDIPVKIDTVRNNKGIRDSIVYLKEKNDSTFYAAFIVRPGFKSPKIISLFDEKELEKILNKMTNNRGVQILDQPATKEKSRELYDIIWAPLEANLKGVKTIYYSPDGLLYKVSFAAMTNTDNKFLFDIYNLKTLNSTREIIALNNPLQLNTDYTCSIYGGIQYDLDANKLIINANKYKQEDKIELANTEKDNFNEIKRGGEWNYLKGTLLEAETIQKEFLNNNIITDVFTGENANEESFKALSSKSPTIIHIATHGFYIADNKNKNSDLGAGNNFKFNKNPLFRSGLMMAGANRVWTGNDAIDGVDDGILTAFEVSNLDLSNTKLVVLSACETGLGEIRGSEGVYGLQRAFKMAGVRYMIITLWEIQDQVTVEFMGTFYKQWLKGKDIYAAFKCTQDEMRKKYEANYWAAFVLVE